MVPQWKIAYLSLRPSSIRGTVKVLYKVTFRLCARGVHATQMGRYLDVGLVQKVSFSAGKYSGIQETLKSKTLLVLRFFGKGYSTLLWRSIFTTVNIFHVNGTSGLSSRITVAKFSSCLFCTDNGMLGTGSDSCPQMISRPVWEGV